MLKIYTSNESRGLVNIQADYEFPENGLSPWEQIAWMDVHIEEFKEKDVVVKTFSPYIMNHLNLLLARGDLNYETLEAYEMVCMEDEEMSIEEYSLKILNDGVELIDTVSLSEPISYIYDEYNKLRPNEHGEKE